MCRALAEEDNPPIFDLRRETTCLLCWLEAVISNSLHEGLLYTGAFRPYSRKDTTPLFIRIKQQIGIF